MWTDRDELVGLQDAVAVPPAVRKALHEALPCDAVVLYSVSDSCVAAVTNHDADAYEAHFSCETATRTPRLLRALWDTRDVRDELLRLLPEGADPSIPVARDVWRLGEDGRPAAPCAVDILFGERPTGFPFEAHVLSFSELDVVKGVFDAPLHVRTTSVVFDNNNL